MKMSSIFNNSLEQNDKLTQDIQQLDSLNDQAFSEFLSIVFEALKSSSQAQNLPVILSEFSKNNSVPVSQVKQMSISLISFIMGCVKRNVSDAQVMKDIVNLGVADVKAQALAEIYKTNQLTLTTYQLMKTSLALNQLVDMEWKFGVTAASSELLRVGQTFLQLKLKIGDGLGGVQTVNMELSLPQFYSFLHEMERAKASLELCS